MSILRSRVPPPRPLARSRKASSGRRGPPRSYCGVSVAGCYGAILWGNKLLASVDVAAHVVARFRRSSPARRRDADERAHDPSKTRPRGRPRVGLWQLAGSDHVYPVVRRAGGRRYRLFVECVSPEKPGQLAESTYCRVWRKARVAALKEDEAASPLARRPYDLRHAAVSTWLNAGVPSTQVAA
jgi:hypothetical protein